MPQRVFAVFSSFILFAGFAAHAASASPDDWQLPRLDSDEQVALSTLRGEVVLLDFWASWCVPCRGSMAALQKLQQEYAGRRVRILPISVDADAGDAREFLARYGRGLRSLHDPDGEVAEAYDLLGMPSSFVIGPTGQVLLRHEGYRAGDEESWRAAINKALQAH